MNSKLRIALFIAISLITNSCINDFELDTGDGSPLVVIEGQIDNDGNNYVRLTYSSPSLTPDSNPYYDNATPINNAKIEISDNTGFSEILIPKLGDLGVFRGFYEASNLIGVTENTYFLKVTIGDKIYSAQAYMPSVPKIDSVGTKLVIGGSGKDDTFQPTIYFSEPQNKKNYYLTKICDSSPYRFTGINCRLNSRVWNYAILDDIFLEPYVNGLNLDDGASPEGRDFNIRQDSLELRLYSLTKESYNHYNALIKQFNNDGGVYQPSPASAPGNIKGGALGFFNASAVSKKILLFDP